MYIFVLPEKIFQYLICFLQLGWCHVKSLTVLKKKVQGLEDDIRRLQDKKITSLDPPKPKASTTVPQLLDVPKLNSATERPVSTGTSASGTGGPTYNGHTEEQLKDSIRHLDKLYDCVHTLITMLFPTDYINSYSVSGQSGNTKLSPKPKFDARLFGVMNMFLRQKFATCSKADITTKVQAVQKKYILKAKKKCTPCLTSKLQLLYEKEKQLK